MKEYVYAVACIVDGKTLLWSTKSKGFVNTFAAADFWVNEDECKKYINSYQAEEVFVQKIKIEFV